MEIYFEKKGVMVNFESTKFREIVVTKQFGPGGPHGSLLLPGLIPIAGQFEPDKEIRNLASFCGITFNEKMMSPHHSKRIVKTASFQQVREPINDKSIGSWRRFEKHLESHAKTLMDAGIHINKKQID